MFDKLPERIRKKIVFTPCPVPNLKGDCWIWTASRHKFGYGFVGIPDKSGRHRCETAHRAVWFLVGRKIPKGRELDHLCRVTACCNPDHLEPVTHAENIARGKWFIATNAAKTHCPQGHTLTDAIQHHHAGRKPSRDCRECGRIRATEYYYRVTRRKNAANRAGD